MLKNRSCLKETNTLHQTWASCALIKYDYSRRERGEGEGRGKIRGTDNIVERISAGPEAQFQMRLVRSVTKSRGMRKRPLGSSWL